jgi:hypothetical protein
MSETLLLPNMEFSTPATRERLEAVAEALRENGMLVMVAADRDEARRLVLEQLPSGAHVHQGASVTLDAIGVTEDGSLVVASASASQIGPLASGAGHVIFAIGSQKIVPDLPTALRRIEEYAFPLEDERAQAAYGMHSALNQILVIHAARPGRIAVILIDEALGF